MNTCEGMDGDNLGSSKQVQANRRNSKKSTGAKTAKGKDTVSQNRISHGLLSKRLILDGENPDEYSQMLDGLMASLHPVGLMEQMLVEKLAVAMWRQQRAVRAEVAIIKTQQRQQSIEFQQQARRLVGNDGDELGFGRIEGMTAQDDDDFEWYTALRAQVGQVMELPQAKQMAHIKKHCPELYQAALDDYDTDTEIQENLSHMLTENQRWADEQISRMKAKQGRQAVLDMLAQAHSAPISNELLHRYQASLDNELYKALMALQKQQEHRIRNMGDMC